TRGVGRKEDLTVERARGRQHLFTRPAVARLIERQLPAGRARRNRRRHTVGEYGDIDEIGIVRDREPGVLRLGQLVKRVVIPDRIAAVLDGRSWAIARALGSVLRVSL